MQNVQHSISYCSRLETVSYQNEHNYRQDVKDGIAEQRPPAQGDRLMRELTPERVKQQL